MTKKLNTDKSAAPLYIQVKEDIIKKIEGGHWKQGEKIKPELELCEYYGVSRITIRNAIDELVWENYLVKKRPLGTFVADYKEKLSDKDYYTYVKSHTYELKELGQDVKTYQTDINIIKATDYLANQLNTTVGTEIIELKRVRGGTKEHPAYFKTYFVNSTDFSTHTEDYYGSFYEILKSKGITLYKIKEYLEAAVPTQEIQDYLNITEDVPVLKRVRNANNEEESFFEYTECYYVGDKYRYYIDLSLDNY